MKNVLRILFFIIGICILSSCSTTQRVAVKYDVNEFVGHTHQEIVNRLGIPTKRVSDGLEGYVLLFEGNRDIFSYSGKYAKNAGKLPSLQLFFNSDGICTNAITTNTQPVKAISVGGTIALVILILLIL